MVAHRSKTTATVGDIDYKAVAAHGSTVHGIQKKGFALREFLSATAPAAVDDFDISFRVLGLAVRYSRAATQATSATMQSSGRPLCRISGRPFFCAVFACRTGAEPAEQPLPLHSSARSTGPPIRPPWDQ